MNVPQEIIQGMKDWRSPYNEKSLNVLFTCNINEFYIKKRIFNKLVNINYLSEILNEFNMPDNPKLLCEIFFKNKQQIMDCINIVKYKLPYTEDLISNNKLAQLHQVNGEYIEEMCRTIIGSPDIIFPKYYDYDQEMGILRNTSTKNFEPRMFTGGIYQPEMDFIDTPHNRKHAYWENVEVEFDPNSYSQMPGHRYASAVYSSHAGTLCDPEQRQTRKFPLGRHFKKHIDRSDFGLRESGQGDRRVQRPHGYNMSDLVNYPSYIN